MKLQVLDLFSGIGGFSLGLESTGGFDTAAFCEIDPAARRVLRKHWPTVPIFEDVTTLKGTDVGRIDVICGGFPCQDLSFARRDAAGLAGSRSGLWFEYLRLISEARPRFALIENVAALRTRGLEHVLAGLHEVGYDAEWHCIPACYVGAWHKRDRIWILAYPHGERGCEGRAAQPLLGQSDLSRPPSRGFAQWPGRSHLPTPFLCGGADGVPRRVDRLKQLGNAVIPQIPEMFGHVILRSLAETQVLP